MSYARKQSRNKADLVQRAFVRVDQFEERNAPMALLGMLGMGGAAFGGLADWQLLSNPAAAHRPAPAQVRVRQLFDNLEDSANDISSVYLVPGSAASEASGTPSDAAPDSGAAASSAASVSPVMDVSPLAPAGESGSDQAAGRAAFRHSTGAVAPAAPPFQATAPNFATNPLPAIAPVSPSGGPSASAFGMATSPDLVAATAITTQAAPANSASAATTNTASNLNPGASVTVQTHVVQAQLLDTPPQPTPEQAQRLASYAPKPGPELSPATGSPAAVQATVATNANHGDTTGPNDFVFFQNNALGSGQGSNLNVTSEANVAANGPASFQTGNFYDSLNGNYGDAGSWRYINPSTTFPNTGDFAGGFCCDQRVAEDQARHLTIWYMQYNDTGPAGSRTNAGRLAAFISPYDMQNGIIHWWDLPARATWGAPLNRSIDYPNMQVSNNYVYITTNEGVSGSGSVNSADVVRFPLSQIASGASQLNGTLWRLGNDISLAATNGATTTMYFGEVTGGNSVRVFRQNESDTNLPPTDINNLPNTYGGTHTSLAPGNVNWTARTDNRMQVGWQGTWANNQAVIGFLWDSAQGSGRPQPFVRGLLLNTSLGVIGAPDIFNNGYAFELPMVATNARGHLGGTLWIGGGTWGNPGTQVLIADDISGFPTNGGWTLFDAGDGSAANGNMGDFNGAQRFDGGGGNTWVGSSYIYTPGVTHRYFWFGRERDRTRPANLNNVPIVGDTLGTAQNTGIGVGGGTFTGTNRMWNVAYGLKHVGMYRFSAAAGGTLTTSTSLPAGGDSADTILRLFNSAGTQLAFNDDCGGGTLYSCINNFVLPNTDTYYLGVSGYPNSSYNPNIGGSGVNAGVGRYGDFQLSIRLVAAPIATRLVVTAPATATAGTPFAVTVRATDNSNNTAIGYRGTVTFSSNDSNGSYPSNYTFTATDAGVHTFTVPPGVTLRTAGARTLTVRDTVSGINGTANVTVNPATANHLGFSTPSGTTAGSPFSVTVSARDQFNNIVPSYAGTVTFASSDPHPATLPNAYTFNPATDQGTHTFTNGVTLYTAPSQTVTATGTSLGSQTNTITVNPAAATHFDFSAPGSTTAGSPFDVTVTARDQFNNIATGYAGTVSLSSSDPYPATLPSDYTFNPAVDHGVHTFSGGVILYTAPGQTVTATGTGIGSQTATITVNPAALDHFGVTSSVDGGSTVAGSPFDVTVTAQDAYNNTVTSYAGTISFSSQDPYGATLPPAYAFQPSDQGTVAFAAGATLYTAGTWDVTVTDTDGFTGSDNVIVTPAAAVAFVIGAPSTAMTGVPFDFSVTATDPYGNTDTNYLGTVTFSTMDPAGTFSPTSYTFGPGDQGSATFPMGCTLNTIGTWDVTATDTNGLTGSAFVDVPAFASGSRQRRVFAEASATVLTTQVQPLPASAAGTLPRVWTPEQPALVPGRVDRLFAGHGTSQRLATLRAKPHDLDIGFIELIDQDTW